MKRVVGSGTYFREGEQGVYFEFGPTWHVWVSEVVESLDELTRHRLCFHFGRLLDRLGKDRPTHFIPLSEEAFRDFYHQAGWDYPLGGADSND